MNADANANADADADADADAEMLMPSFPSGPTNSVNSQPQNETPIYI